MWAFVHVACGEKGAVAVPSETSTEGDPRSGPTDTTVTGAEASGRASFGAASDTSDPGTSGAPCEEGELGCPCIGKGECHGTLRCYNTICLDLGAPCPFTNDGVCHEPLDCPLGSDVEDCCPTLGDGVCEERSRGGVCPDGTDDYDCGRCRTEYDGWCDVPRSCPSGTDLRDCCANVRDGRCDEVGRGGTCEAGSDNYDCGVCPPAWRENGLCDERKGSDLCPMDSDPECRAVERDGTCDEVDFGGAFGRWSDAYDCGYCRPSENVPGRCDEPEGTDVCPEGSDPVDCGGGG